MASENGPADSATSETPISPTPEILKPGAKLENNSIPFHRLYVGNIHFSITEQDLQNVFEPFGELEFVQLQKEEGGRSRGYGFVQSVFLILVIARGHKQNPPNVSVEKVVRKEIIQLVNATGKILYVLQRGTKL